MKKNDDIFNLSMTELLLIITFALLLVMVILNSSLQSMKQEKAEQQQNIIQLHQEVQEIAQQLGLQDGEQGLSPIDITTALVQLQALVDVLSKAVNEPNAEQVLMKMPLSEIFSSLVELIHNGYGFNVDEILAKLDKIESALHEANGLKKDVQTLKNEILQMEKILKENQEIASLIDNYKNQIKEQNEQLIEVKQQLSDLEKTLENKETENKELIAKIQQMLGRGMVYPPCWIDTKTNKTQYTFTVEVTDDYLYVVQSFPQQRLDDFLAITQGQSFHHVRMSPNDFRQKMSAFLDHAKEQAPECRFYAKVKDFTSPGAKSEWKQGLAAVESAFYKLLL